MYRRLLVVLFSLLALPTTASAQARNWRVADFQDTISIAADGTALVSEKITLAFVGEWHGIHRTIPVEYPGPQGTNYTLFLERHERHRRKRKQVEVRFQQVRSLPRS